MDHMRINKILSSWTKSTLKTWSSPKHFQQDHNHCKMSHITCNTSRKCENEEKEHHFAPHGQKMEALLCTSWTKENEGLLWFWKWKVLYRDPRVKVLLGFCSLFAFLPLCSFPFLFILLFFMHHLAPLGCFCPCITTV